MDDRFVKIIIFLFLTIAVLLVVVILITTSLFFDFRDQTFSQTQQPSVSKKASDICNGIKIKFKNQEVEEEVIQKILKTVGAAEGDYNPKDGVLFIPLKDKCDKLSVVLATNSIRNIPEIDYATPVILNP